MNRVTLPLILVLLLALPALSKPAAKKKTSADKTTEDSSSFRIKARGAYLMPMGDWKDLIDRGYGDMIEFDYSGLFLNNLNIGIETGFLYAEGKADIVNSEYIVPVFATLAYEIPLFWKLSIAPKLSAGEGYFNISRKAATINSPAESKTAFEFMTKAGTSILCDIGESIAIEAVAEYGMIFEKDGQLPFVLLQIGCSIYF